MKKYLIAFFLIPVFAATGQRITTIDSITDEGLMLNQNWKWQAGDNLAWANPEFDDSSWQTFDPTQELDNIPQLTQKRIGWFRTTIEFSPLAAQRLTTLLMNQSVASEVYINGLLAKKIGIVSANPDSVEAPNVRITSVIGLPYSVSYPFVQIAIRVAYEDSPFYHRVGFSKNYCLLPRVIETQYANQTNYAVRQQIYYGWFQVGVFFILTFLHLAFFALYRHQRANLYFSLTTFFLGIAFLCTPLSFDYFERLSEYFMAEIAQTLAFPVAYIFLLRAIYEIYHQPKGLLFWLLILFAVSVAGLLFTPYSLGSVGVELGTELLMTAEIIRITALALRKRQPGARLIMIGMLLSLTLFLVFYADYLLEYGGMEPFFKKVIDSITIYQIAILCVPLCISLHLAIDFSKTNRQLIQQLQENNALNQKNLLQEQEKQQILAAQNETLEQQVKERTAELNYSLTELKAAQNQLIQKEKLASLGELTAGIAHEIQNPLNFVNNFSELSVELIEECLPIASANRPGGANEDWIPEEAPFGGWGLFFSDLKLNLQKINHHGKRASSIVKGMLEHSRSSTGERVLTDINQLADEYLRLSYHGMRAKDKSFNADFEFIPDPNLPKINVVPQDIGRVLLNLINNAFQSQAPPAPDGGAKSPLTSFVKKVTVRTFTFEANSKAPFGGLGAVAGLGVSVSDNGNGMSEEVKAKIFQPFFTTKPTGEGTGLGLSLSYDIITKGHGGTLEVISKEGEGAEFIVRLPIQ